jgi:uncharacterized protein YjbJ (UPF0337 family)
MARRTGRKVTKVKKCNQTLCGFTCISTEKTCRVNQPNAQANIKRGTKALKATIGDRAWLATRQVQKGTGRVKDTVKDRVLKTGQKIRQGAVNLGNQAWFNKERITRKISTALQKVVRSLVNAVKKLGSIPATLKREGVAGVKNRAWLATRQVQKGTGRVKDTVKDKVLKTGQKVRQGAVNLSNQAWFNRRSRQLATVGI